MQQLDLGERSELPSNIMLPDHQDNIDRSSNHRQADLIGPSFQQSANRSSPNHQGFIHDNRSMRFKHNIGSAWEVRAGSLQGPNQ
ncbi:hypothetical protein F7725_018754 [Dissostichus mawsoni]|uniref:Uncharacterized protein n=1 Tax=Dissostichus mawsoni TaxID=36200 RepID=A0A7J5XTY9_DISMA|nr:hypothetical protein F7725_018754 [Dissostichus mawsoni]